MTQTTPGNPAARPACVGLLCGICVGVPDRADSSACWKRFGCRAKRFGTLGEVTGTRAPRPFAEPIVGVREKIVIRPLYRQVSYERFGDERPARASSRSCVSRHRAASPT